MTRPARPAAGLALAALLAAGCGGDPGLTPVEGTLTGPDGKPLPDVLVQFTPTDPGGRRVVSSSGTTDAAGRFVLRADTGRPGAVPGPHAVLLSDQGFGDDDDPPGRGRPRPPVRIPADYSSPAKTPLKVTVEAGKADYPLKVERR
jgi:hypothetical protein